METNRAVIDEVSAAYERGRQLGRAEAFRDAANALVELMQKDRLVPAPKKDSET